MSYILDALRRADSERERGAVPSIHSPPAPQVADDPKPQGNPAKALVGVIVALLLALAGLLAWHLFSGKDTPREATDQAASDLPSPPAQSPQVAQDVPLPSTPSLAPPAEPARPMAQAQAPVRPMATAPAVPAPQPAPAPFQQHRPAQAQQPQFQPQQAPVLSVPERVKPSPSNMVPATPPTMPEADTRVHATSELPANIQRELPKLVVGGAMYSDTPANRMLIINSQVFHEGDKLAPELVLQEIKLKSAVFKYKGYRYGVSY